MYQCNPCIAGKVPNSVLVPDGPSDHEAPRWFLENRPIEIAACLGQTAMGRETVKVESLRC